ncbi:L,D-transpeptidase family protein [Sphingomonas sp. URHD0057]|uniref:L,D-transpeptidase family protein n=1 Tax=Sphingomonas sp. URHD0057 TaxID=1380389 RepID=UPI0009DCED25|nr:L,D-transpeptidase family protein [Sphingomonas sp. URHD0057]
MWDLKQLGWVMMGKRDFVKALVLGASIPALVSAASVSAQLSPTPPAVSLPVLTSVAGFYDTHRTQPIWFRNGVNPAVVAQLTAILQRAAFDGLAAGPQLAAQVQAAAAQAGSGRPEDMDNAERTMSSAWVQYVQAIKKPTTGMIYAYPVLQPQGSRADQILLTAAAAPSLESYVATTARVNPIYAQLRDTAWSQAQASGNLTPDPRLLANLDRIRSLPATGRFLLVDSGTSMLTLFDNGQQIDSMKVITGTNELPTPLIASVMYYITYNPYWHAPDHLVRKTIAPNVLKLGMSYFKSHGYSVIEDWSETPKVVDPKTVDWKAAASGSLHLKIQQAPGPLNSMGILKFPFPNPEDIYLHDTPDHAKFALANRNLSNGCVRVEDAKRLGRWLLGREPVAPGTDAETRVQLQQGTRIYLTYITAQVRDGKLSYLPDIYGWDRTAPQFASN